MPVSSDKLDALKQRLQENVPNDTNKTVTGPTLKEKRKKLAEKKKSKKKNDSSSFGSDSSSVQPKSEKADTVKPLVEESSQNIGAAERQNRL